MQGLQPKPASPKILANKPNSELLAVNLFSGIFLFIIFMTIIYRFVPDEPPLALDEVTKLYGLFTLAIISGGAGGLILLSIAEALTDGSDYSGGQIALTVSLLIFDIFFGFCLVLVNWYKIPAIDWSQQPEGAAPTVTAAQGLCDITGDSLVGRVDVEPYLPSDVEEAEEPV